MTEKKLGENMAVLSREFASTIQDTLGDREKMIGLMAEIRADHAKADACPRHQFRGGKVAFGAKTKCNHCGVEFRLTDIGNYLRGYKAAGGDVNDVWPGWNA